MEKTPYELVVEYVEKHAPEGTSEEDKKKMINARVVMFIRA